MDVAFFLKERTAFIKYYFDEAAAPFIETMRKIKAQESPFEPPDFDPETETGEPPFLDEWLRAQTGLEVTGQTCVSMLSESLKIFFVTHEKNAGLDCEDTCGKNVFKKGVVSGYRTCFAKHGIDWSLCPVDFSILEQVVLVRNASQHATSLTSSRKNHDAAVLRKHSHLLFISDYEKDVLSNRGGSWMVEPTIHVTRDALHQAIEEVEKLAEWLQSD